MEDRNILAMPLSRSVIGCRILKNIKQIVAFAVLFGIVVFGTFWQRGQKQTLERIRVGVNAAEVGFKPVSGLPEVERLAQGLRAVDSSGAPSAIREALDNYLAAVERHEAKLRRTGGWDTNTAWPIGDTQKAFREALTKPQFKVW